MTVASRAVSVTTTATRLDTVDDTGDTQVGESVAVYNNGSAIIYLGGPSVTAAAGCPVPANSWGPSFDLGGGDALFGIVASGTADVRVLETGI